MVASSVKDARAVRSDAALRQALLVLLDKRSFDQITVRDICAEAGVHYATFFRHHSGKEALLNHVAADQIGRLVELSLPYHEPTGEGRGFEMLCLYVEEHRALWTVLLNGGAGAAMREEWLRRARIVAERHEAAATWLPKELGTICSVGLIVETISWWLSQPAERYTAAAIANILRQIHASLLEP